MKCVAAGIASDSIAAVYASKRSEAEMHLQLYYCLHPKRVEPPDAVLTCLSQLLSMTVLLQELRLIA